MGTQTHLVTLIKNLYESNMAAVRLDQRLSMDLDRGVFCHMICSAFMEDVFGGMDWWAKLTG